MRSKASELAELFGTMRQVGHTQAVLEGAYGMARADRRCAVLCLNLKQAKQLQQRYRNSFHFDPSTDERVHFISVHDLDEFRGDPIPVLLEPTVLHAIMMSESKFRDYITDRLSRMVEALEIFKAVISEWP